MEDLEKYIIVLLSKPPTRHDLLNTKDFNFKSLQFKAFHTRKLILQINLGLLSSLSLTEVRDKHTDEDFNFK